MEHARTRTTILAALSGLGLLGGVLSRGRVNPELGVPAYRGGRDAGSAELPP